MIRQTEVQQLNNELTIQAKAENMSVVTDFITIQLKKAGITGKIINSLNIAADEIFSNICKYAYPSVPGDVNISVKTGTDGVRVTFTDTGIPFDPLEMPDPDITQSAEERDFGGLGILMVKKLMDETMYSYEDGRNVLTVFKNTQS